MPAPLAEIEARHAALEAERADYRAVLAALTVLSGQTHERLDQLHAKIDGVEERLGARIDGVEERLGSRIADTNARVRSIEENVAEVKDLLIRALDRG